MAARIIKQKTSLSRKDFEKEFTNVLKTKDMLLKKNGIQIEDLVL